DTAIGIEHVHGWSRKRGRKRAECVTSPAKPTPVKVLPATGRSPQRDPVSEIKCSFPRGRVLLLCRKSLYDYRHIMGPACDTPGNTSSKPTRGSSRKPRFGFARRA